MLWSSFRTSSSCVFGKPSGGDGPPLRRAQRRTLNVAPPDKFGRTSLFRSGDALVCACEQFPDPCHHRSPSLQARSRASAGTVTRTRCVGCLNSWPSKAGSWRAGRTGGRRSMTRRRLYHGGYGPRSQPRHPPRPEGVACGTASVQPTYLVCRALDRLHRSRLDGNFFAVSSPRPGLLGSRSFPSSAARRPSRGWRTFTIRPSRRCRRHSRSFRRRS